MATAREHMAADMAWLFAENGEEAADHLLDGQVIRAMVGDETTAQYEDGSWFASRELILQTATAAGAVPRQRMELDGINYLIEAVRSTPVLSFITLTRSVA